MTTSVPHDRRLWPANARVALRSLGPQAGLTPVDGTPATLTHPVTDLLTAPDGRRDRQLLLGQAVTVLEDRAGWSFVQAGDGYVGYVPSDRLTAETVPTHRVGTFATHAYAAEDMKSPDVMQLPFGARVRVLDERRAFFETPQGFIPKKHLRPLDRPFTSPATIAQLHFGVPYLWGGNSTRGLDCSGLIAAALTACDMPCPGDADLQEQALGDALAPDAELQRGDLIFWCGHVGMMVDPATMIHANANAMAVTYEPLANAILRIRTVEASEVTSRRRVKGLCI
ncbi:C40 family peptidase [Loktanella sp. DJP18]|uniref:C40 family peptidase n=1 Tax=Loktanella sp. DJP18 TaxID=3409788 RepID=UPI003BB6B814